MRSFSVIILFLVFCHFYTSCSSSKALNSKLIVVNGKPNAEIILSDSPTRSQKFAASELQKYIEKISGAKLPIYSETINFFESKRYKNKIYIGNFESTDNLGVERITSQWGDYQILGKENYLSLCGYDKDFEPQGIWASSRRDWSDNKIKAWKKLTNNKGWLNNVGSSMWNRYNKDIDLWAFDHKGSLNAVYGYLRDLGVRWFMPGENGEYVPKMDNISIPIIKKVVSANFKIRKMSFARFGNGKQILPDILWFLRQGANYPYGYHDYHGISNISRSQYNRDNNPYYYALYNGKRSVEGKTPEHCLSSEGLFQENLEYIRFMFDMYDLPVISVWPDDGYTKICECNLCKNKAAPERGSTGILSDYVWEYVNNIAKEVEKTHPDKYIIGGAYSAYFLPPGKIEKLNPNVMVYLVNPRRRYKIDNKNSKVTFTKEKLYQVTKEWNRLSNGKVISFMNHGNASNTPNIFIEDIKSIKDLVIGEDIWTPIRRGGGLKNIAFYHLNYYVSARLWWNPALDGNKLLDEYYNLFYGPAANEMRAFIDFYESNQQLLSRNDEADKLKIALDLFDNAKNKVKKETVYYKRLKQFEEEIANYRKRYDQIKIKRNNNRSVRAVAPSKWVSKIKIDGNLDETYWTRLPHRLKNNFTNKNPLFPTNFKIGFNGNKLYLGVKSKIDINKKHKTKITDRDDTKLWNGDYIDILIETPLNSFYQISVSPSGSIVDFDRGDSFGGGLKWSSEIDYESKIDSKNGFWNIEMIIPISTSDQDPLHKIIGVPPKNNFSWYFNICKKYTSKNNTEFSALSPTSKNSFLKKEAFVELKYK